MTLFQPQHDRFRRLAGGSRSPIASTWRVFARRAMGRTGAAFVLMHRAIVTAKTRRPRRELMLHKIPQQPLILDDKWDF